MSPSSKFDRRQFFARAIAFVAALFTPKPSAEEPGLTLEEFNARVWPKPAAQVYGYLENGHTFYVWPTPQLRHYEALCMVNPITQEPIPDMPFPRHLNPILSGPYKNAAPMQFSRDAFTLEMPRLEPDQVDAAFEEVNRMMDRWSAEPFYAPPPKIDVTILAP